MLTLPDQVPSHDPTGNDGRPGDNGPHWRRSQDAAVTPYSEEGAVDYPMAYHAPRFKSSGAILPAPVGAGTVTRMMPDEFEALKMWTAEERRCAPSWTFPPLRASPKTWASSVSMRPYDHAPLLRFLMPAIRFLMLATAGSAEGR